jgi:hypothetical protein
MYPFGPGVTTTGGTVLGTVVVVVEGIEVVPGPGPLLPHAGAPPIPHLPRPLSAAFTGPEKCNAFESAAIGRSTETATLRRVPIGPVSAEWYS